jgi:hypothetical protein
VEGSLIASPLGEGEGEGEGGGAATKAEIRAGVETILIMDCRDREGHGDRYPSRKQWSMTLPTTAGTTMAGITLILITTLFVVCTAKLAMKHRNSIFQPDGAAPPRIGTYPELGGGTLPNNV